MNYTEQVLGIFLFANISDSGDTRLLCHHSMVDISVPLGSHYICFPCFLCDLSIILFAWTCLTVAGRLQLQVSSSRITREKNTVSLSVIICFMTYACIVNLSMNAFTTNLAAGFRIGSAKRYRNSSQR